MCLSRKRTIGLIMGQDRSEIVTNFRWDKSGLQLHANSEALTRPTNAKIFLINQQKLGTKCNRQAYEITACMWVNVCQSDCTQQKNLCYLNVFISRISHKDVCLHVRRSIVS